MLDEEILLPLGILVVVSLTNLVHGVFTTYVDKGKRMRAFPKYTKMNEKFDNENHEFCKIQSEFSEVTYL